MANSVMLILLYFEDYTGAMIGVVLFAVISLCGTIAQMLFGRQVFFGMAFSLGAAVFMITAIIRLEWCSRNLQYLLLGRQEYLADQPRGIFVWLSGKLSGKEEVYHGQEE
jgi:uncharacterized membrane protein